MRLRYVVVDVAVVAAALGAGFAVEAVAATSSPRLEATIAPLDEFTPTAPTRLLDTRTGQGADGPGRVNPGQVVPVLVPAGALAVAVNLKLVDAVGGGWAVAWSGRPPLPTGSSIDDNGTSPVNGYVVSEVDPVCGCFRVLFSAQLSADLVVDMAGVFGRQPEFAVGPPPVP